MLKTIKVKDLEITLTKKPDGKVSWDSTDNDGDRNYEVLTKEELGEITELIDFFL